MEWVMQYVFLSAEFTVLKYNMGWEFRWVEKRNRTSVQKRFATQSSERRQRYENNTVRRYVMRRGVRGKCLRITCTEERVYYCCWIFVSYCQKVQFLSCDRFRPCAYCNSES